jgi:hypothetical protein
MVVFGGCSEARSAHVAASTDCARKTRIGSFSTDISSDTLKHVVEPYYFLRRHSSGRATLEAGKAIPPQNAAKDKYC